MRILVTGSEGSLMQWTIKNLIMEKHDVIGIDNQFRYDEETYRKMKIAEDYEYIKGDLTNYDVLKKVGEVNGIIQGAAKIYGVKVFHENPADILSNDIQLHSNICKFAKDKDIRKLVYISSSIVYERDDPPHRESEVFDLKIPSTDYGLSKVVGERMCMAFKKQYGIDYTIWRPFNIITPYEKGEEEEGLSHVFADFIRKLLFEKQNPMRIFGSGKQIRCFTWIDDIARTIAEWSFSEVTANESYNLANPEPVTMKELAQRIFEKGKEKGLIDGEELEFEHVPIYDDDIEQRIPSTEKAEQELDWNPTVKLEEALERCIENAQELYEIS
ncbi:MAG: NAD(P)-dependent oxidoreductase [Candidatus Thorarchaeota archaeon]